MTRIFVFICSIFSWYSIGQEELHFSEIGAEPAHCRTAGYQSGNGVVYASASGGVPDYTYVWTSFSGDSIITTSNTTWGGLNPGKYVITVTDNVGAQISAVVQVDSINPVAKFNVVGLEENNGIYEGTAPVNIDFENTSFPVYQFYPGFPFADTIFSWKIGDADWIVQPSIFESSYYDFYLDQPFSGDVCLAFTNKNGCSDTICKTINVVDPSGTNSNSGQFALVSNYENHTITIFNLSGYDCEVYIYDSSGNFLMNAPLPFLENSIPFNYESGTYIFNILNPLSGEIYDSGQFIY